MDKLTKKSQDHGEIFESLTLFQNLMPSFSNTDIGKFKKFLDEHIEKHFEFEEKEIFPIILNNGADEEKALIEELQHQHKEMLNMITQLEKLMSEYSLKSSKNNKEKLRELCGRIIKSLLAHARKEDVNIFPVLKKYLR